MQCSRKNIITVKFTDQLNVAINFIIRLKYMRHFNFFSLLDSISQDLKVIYLLHVIFTTVSSERNVAPLIFSLQEKSKHRKSHTNGNILKMGINSISCIIKKKISQMTFTNI